MTARFARSMYVNVIDSFQRSVDVSKWLFARGILCILGGPEMSGLVFPAFYFLNR